MCTSSNKNAKKVNSLYFHVQPSAGATAEREEARAGEKEGGRSMPRKPPSHMHTHTHTLDNIYLQELIAVGNDSYHTMHCLVLQIATSHTHTHTHTYICI